MVEGVVGGEGVVAATGAVEGVVEALAALAHPSYLAGRDTGHEGVVGDVACDHGAGGDEGRAPHGVAADNSAVGPEGGPFLN